MTLPYQREAALVREALDQSQLSVVAFGWYFVLAGDRTVRRWLSGTAAVPVRVVEWCAWYCAQPPEIIALLGGMVRERMRRGKPWH